MRYRCSWAGSRGFVWSGCVGGERQVGFLLLAVDECPDLVDDLA